jgi:hypothetical protein
MTKCIMCEQEREKGLILLSGVGWMCIEGCYGKFCGLREKVLTQDKKTNVEFGGRKYGT